MEIAKGIATEIEMGRGGNKEANNFVELKHAFVNYYFNIYNCKKQLNYPNIKSVLFSFKVASLR
jgi:hypothetical protein